MQAVCRDPSAGTLEKPCGPEVPPGFPFGGWPRVDGLADTPGPVRRCSYPRRRGGHLSTNTVTDALQQPTRTLGRAALERALSDLAPGGVYLAAPVTRCAGGLLHHPFTLTCTGKQCGRFTFCGTSLRVTPSGRYPPPCSVEPGRSSVIGGLLRPVNAAAWPTHPHPF